MQPGVRAAVALLAGLIAVAASWVGYQVHRRHAAAAERAQLWADFTTCLVGEPLAEGETLESRFRGIEMALQRDPRDPPSSGEWPLVCAPRRDALVSSWAMARRAALRDAVLVGWGHLVRKRSPSQLSQAFELARNIPSVPVTPGVPRPPAPERPLVGSPSVPASGFLRAPLALAREGEVMHLLSQDGRACEASASGAALQCKQLRGLPADATLGYVPRSGSPAHAIRLGNAKGALLALDGGRAEIPPGAPLAVGWPGPTPVDAARALVLTRGDGDRLLALGDASSSKPADLGSAGPVVRPLSCSEASLVGIVVGHDEPERWRESYDELRVFRLPGFERVAAVALGGPKHRAHLPSLRCGEALADFGWAESAGTSHRVRRLRCRASGCEESRAELTGLSTLGFSSGRAGVDAALRAAPTRDGMALVWWSPDEALRVVVAPVDRLGTSAPRVLFDASATALAPLSVQRAWLADLVLQPAGDATFALATLGSKEALVLRLDAAGGASLLAPDPPVR